MAATVANQTPPCPRSSWIKRLALKIATLVLLGLLLGFGYDWAAPRLYGPERVAGFPLGIVHGALMPVALPSLLLGKDVPIYAERNLGRSYKLGYIAGINACGFIFFGLAFWQPARPSAKAAESPAPG
jgi:TRAP-type C4-dicarboxylate transport system permease small subunit